MNAEQEAKLKAERRKTKLSWKRDKDEVGSRDKDESRIEQAVKLKAEQEAKQVEDGSRGKAEGTT